MESAARSPAIRRLCVAVDVEQYSRLDRDEQWQVQRDLLGVLERASVDVDVPRLDWIRQETGDGELALLPPGIDETGFITGFVAGLRRTLYHHNRRVRPRLRLRVALHQGITQIADTGFAGPAVVTVARLCDAAVAKRMLAENVHADYVLVLSHQLFEDFIGNNRHDLTPETFTHVRIDVPEKAFFADAWVQVPESGSVPRSASPTDSGTPDGPAEDGEDPPPGATGGPPAAPPGGIVSGRDTTIAGRDVVRGSVHHVGRPR